MDLSKLAQWWASTSAPELTWLAIGFLAQLMFSMRFIVQWLASERARQSIVPEAFWYFSCAGGLMLLAYAIYRMDPVFILGQAGGLLIYARNIHFIWQHKAEAAPVAAARELPPSHS
ncbi:MAG: lipid-A-disaccharide synthase N-terminal domain-containing protein [Bacteroidota bacterium]